MGRRPVVPTPLGGVSTRPELPTHAGRPAPSSGLGSQSLLRHGAVCSPSAPQQPRDTGPHPERWWGCAVPGRASQGGRVRPVPGWAPRPHGRAPWGRGREEGGLTGGGLRRVSYQPHSCPTTHLACLGQNQVPRRGGLTVSRREGGAWDAGLPFLTSER